MTREVKKEEAQDITVVSKTPAKAAGWGKENYPYPQGPGYIETDEMRCVGCGICQMACSMMHFGVINKNLSRIQVRKYLLPVPKAIQVTCVQCTEEERECEKACPVSPKAIYFDKKTQHMVLNKETCLGNSCLACQAACPSKAVVSAPQSSKTPIVCDLCDIANTGHTNPQCVGVCPTTALYFVPSVEGNSYSFPFMSRFHADEKAKLVARRLYPLTKETMWRPQGGKK